MATKPIAPPGQELSATELAKQLVAENKDELNAQATEFNDGEYGNVVVNNSPEIKEADSLGTGAGETETATTISAASSEKVYVAPQTIAQTADGRVLQLPLPNELRNFASFNYKIGLYALTNDEINNPDNTYRIKRPGIAIMQSGGGLGDSKVLTAYEINGKKIEFFCNSLEIETIIAPSRRKGTTNATGFRLEIMEPYSMGLFLQTLQVAAFQAGHYNYTEAPFLLTLDFVGFDNDGNPFPVPSGSKLLPFKLVGSELEVTNGGSSYVVEGVAYNEGALKDATQSIPCDVTLVGRTLEQLLQSSPKSLATELNKYYGQKAIEGTITTADQYYIVFPKTRATKGTSSASGAETAQGATTQNNGGGVNSVSISATSSVRSKPNVEEIQRLYEMIKDGSMDDETSADMEEFLSDLKRLVSTSSIGQEIIDKQTGEANSNDIGKSVMFDLAKLGSTSQPFGDASFTWDKDQNVWKRSGGQMQLSPGLGEIKFAQGTRIQDIVEELIIISEYGRNLTKQPSDANGMKSWFKIDTQIFNITDPTTEKKTGQPPRVYVFRILPFLVHESKFLSPDKIPYGIEALKQQVCKEYDYIYSGKNDDILSFNINLDNTFFKSISPGILPKVQDQEGSKEGENPKDSLAQSEVDNTQQTSGKTQATLENNSRAGGAVDVDDMRIEVARRFNDAIVNSDADLLTLEMEIWGDPYYISDSGIGNYNSENTEFINIDADGNVDYQYGEVDVQLNFRTPVDYRDNGIMGFPEETVAVDAFSGLYQVIMVKNVIANGEFKQTLELVRRPNQYPKKPTDQSAEKAPQDIKPADAPTKLSDNLGTISDAQKAEAEGFASADTLVGTVITNRIQSQDAKNQTGVDQFGGNTDI